MRLTYREQILICDIIHQADADEMIYLLGSCNDDTKKEDILACWHYQKR